MATRAALREKISDDADDFTHVGMKRLLKLLVQTADPIILGKLTLTSCEELPFGQEHGEEPWLQLNVSIKTQQYERECR